MCKQLVKLKVGGHVSKFYRIRVLLVVCFILVSGLLASCFTVAPPSQPTLEPAALPIALSAFYYNGKITIDFSQTMDRTTVQRAFALYAGIYNPSANPAKFTKLQLTSMCNGKWRVRNPNGVPISFTWDVYKGAEKGIGVVPSNSDSFFYTDARPNTGNKTARLYVNDKHQQTKAANPAPCSGTSAISTLSNVVTANDTP
jgi:hypothetical protein